MTLAPSNLGSDISVSRPVAFFDTTGTQLIQTSAQTVSACGDVISSQFPPLTKKEISLFPLYVANASIADCWPLVEAYFVAFQSTAFSYGDRAVKSPLPSPTSTKEELRAGLFLLVCFVFMCVFM